MIGFGVDGGLLLVGLAYGAGCAVLGVAAGLASRMHSQLNFALGDLAVLGAAIVWLIESGLDLDARSAPVIAATIGFSIGWIARRIGLAALAERSHLAAAGVTLALGLALAQALSAAARGAPFVAAPASEEAVSLALPLLWTLAWCAAIAAVVVWCLRRSRSGRAIRALGEHRRAAIALGIEPRGLGRLAFATSSAMALGAGAALALCAPLGPRDGLALTVIAYTAVLFAGSRALGALLAVGFALGMVDGIARSALFGLFGLGEHGHWALLIALLGAALISRRLWGTLS